MADKKISALTASSTPLAGTEVLPIVQSGSTVKVSVSDLTAGRVVSASGAAVNATFKAWSVVNAYQVGTGASFGGGVGFADGFATCNSYYDGAAWRRIVAAGASQVALTPSTGLRFNIAGTGTADSTMTWTEVGSFSALADFTVNSGNVVMGTANKGIVDSTGTTSLQFTAFQLVSNKQIIAPSVVTATGSTASTPTATPVTLFTPSGDGVWIVNALVTLTGAPAAYIASSMIKASGGVLAATAISTATNMSISVSGANVQATQTSGGDQIIAFSYIRLF